MGTQNSKKDETDDSSSSAPSSTIHTPQVHEEAEEGEIHHQHHDDLPPLHKMGDPSPFPMSPLDPPMGMLNRRGNRMSTSDDEDDDEGDDSSDEMHMPAVFEWRHGGNRVFVMGSYDNWTTKREMHRSHNDFTLIIDVPPGAHDYQFEVDSQMRLDPDKETRRNSEGAIHNIVNVKSPAEMEDTTTHDSKPYSQERPDFAEYLKEPPLLPPHLNFILLNNQPTQRHVDPLTLPVPQHVTVNHFYMAEQKDSDVQVFGITQRYETKFVTTVYYKPTKTSDHEQDVDINQETKEVDLGGVILRRVDDDEKDFFGKSSLRQPDHNIVDSPSGDKNDENFKMK